MIRLENIKDKSKLVEQYYSWLFDENSISLEKQLDISLLSTYNDPYIYYPECMHDLFNTQSLQRLGRVSQLGTMFQKYSGAFHTRLDHSIGAFEKKQEEHIYLWQQSPEFVKYVETNELKKFLIAEEIKMLYHDVGHLPFSHVTEQQVIGKRAVHEEIGRNILLTDEEVVTAASKLGITDELQTVLTKNIFNSVEHDEGNIDVDRKDYLQRDSLHVGGPKFGFYPIYSRKIAEVNPDGSYKKSSEGHIIMSESLGENSRFIDVYPYSEFSRVEGFLNGRETQYQNKYFHPSILARDTILGIVLNKIVPENSEYCPDLMEYINFLKAHDYASAVKYDDVRIYKSLINLGLNSDDPNVVDMVSLLFSPFDNWLETMSEQLDKVKDADFIKSIRKDLVKGNSRFAQNIKNKNFFNEQVTFIEGENSFELKRKGFSHLIYNSHTFSAYSPSNCVFVEDKTGNVFPLEEHPERSRDWMNTRTYSNVAICILPLLRLKGLSNFKIADYAMQCKQMRTNTSIDKTLLPSVKIRHYPTSESVQFYSDDDER